MLRSWQTGEFMRYRVESAQMKGGVAKS